MPEILVIDDKQDNLIVISALLKNMIPDCRVITAQSGARGIEMARAELPDTILLDIRMPGMDGYETCQRIKNDPFIKHIPVILISAIMTETDDFIKGFETGADAYLAKPIDESILAAQVKASLRIKEAEDALRNEKSRLEEMVLERTWALQESEARYRTLAENSPDIFFRYDRQLRHIFVSSNVVKLSGRSADQYMGKTHEELGYSAEESELWCNGIRTVFQTGKPCSIEYEYASVHGPVNINMPLVPEFGEDGSVETVLGICRDITENRKIQEQLRQAQKVEAIGTLAGGIAHDLNNILFPILGYAEMLTGDLPEESPCQDYAREIMAGANRAKELISQILAFCRHSDTALEPLNIQDVIKDVLKFVKSTLPATITISQDIDDQCGPVMADTTQVHQIIMNLVTNAYHAMEANGGKLEISLKERELGHSDMEDPHMPPGGWVCLSIKDTGSGIDKDVIDRIFDPYFTTKEKNKGTGLGLSVVRGIVESYHGKVKVYSEPGKGTSFYIYLPRIKDRIFNDETDVKATVKGQNERILLIDDEEQIVKMETTILEQHGYNITAFSNSLDALDTFYKNPADFDVVITDMTMPNLTGIRLAEKLKTIRPDIPIILCTGFIDKKTEQEAKSADIEKIITKPVMINEITHSLRDLLNF